MEVYTIQLGQWRLAKELDIPLIDTTYRSGIMHQNVRWLAPTGELLGNYKSGNASACDYQQIYLNIMRARWSQDPQWFIDFVVSMTRSPWLVIVGLVSFVTVYYSSISSAISVSNITSPSPTPGNLKGLPNEQVCLYADY